MKLPPALNEYLLSDAFRAHWEALEHEVIMSFGHTPADRLQALHARLEAMRDMYEYIIITAEGQSHEQT